MLGQDTCPNIDCRLKHPVSVLSIANKYPSQTPTYELINKIFSRHLVACSCTILNPGLVRSWHEGC